MNIHTSVCVEYLCMKNKTFSTVLAAEQPNSSVLDVQAWLPFEMMNNVIKQKHAAH